jgi:hypothetical protein
MTRITDIFAVAVGRLGQGDDDRADIAAVDQVVWAMTSG